MEMRRIHRTLPALLLSLLALTAVAASCEGIGFRDICYDHSHMVGVSVRFDWTDCPDADPEAMSVWFYSLDDPSSVPKRYDLPGRDGGTVHIRYGNYMVLCLNAETDAVLYGGTSSWDGFRLYTPPLDGDLILEPNRMWASSIEGLTLEMGLEDAEIVFPMSPRTLNVGIILLNVPNIRHASGMAASLSGMSSSVGLVSGSQDNNHISIPFEFIREGDSTLTVSVETFGHCPGDFRADPGTHLLTLTATLSNGSVWSHSVDVTEEMHDPSNMIDGSHLRIVLDGRIPIPRPVAGGGGMSASVGGWDEEEIYVGNGKGHKKTEMNRITSRIQIINIFNNLNNPNNEEIIFDSLCGGDDSPCRVRQDRVRLRPERDDRLPHDSRLVNQGDKHHHLEPRVVQRLRDQNFGPVRVFLRCGFQPWRGRYFHFRGRIPLACRKS